MFTYRPGFKRNATVAALLLAAALVAAPAFSAQAPPNVAERLGHPPDARLLVIHADDLGMMRSVNRATFEALERGWVTSASILVPCPWFPQVARFAREHPDADLGIHLALNSEWTGYRWGPVLGGWQVPSLLDADGYLPLVQQEVIERAKPDEVERELRAQIDRARAAGIDVTHLDAHMGTAVMSPELFRVYQKLGGEYRVPVLLENQPPPGRPAAAGQSLVDRMLEMTPGVPPDRANLWLDAYKAMLAPLSPGVYQLIVHLGYDDEELRGATWDHPDWGARWRQADFDLVRSAEFQQFLRDEKFVLVSWRDLARARR
ncbi:MAG: polysaccharide deacetylase family protein [Gemmatimonadetes bacterium]|nr:polysaccharide deacetylase family protein [Gemmatimonadota bacterium]